MYTKGWPIAFSFAIYGLGTPTFSEIGHYLPLVITDDVLATIIQVSPLVHDNLALTPGADKGPTALHLNKLSTNGHSACNLVT
jgi:hypothetical protein